MSIIMRAILPDHAPNTYSGQWPGETPPFPGLESPTIAHHELAASAGFATFDVPQRDLPGNRSPPRWKYACCAKRKICAPGEGARFSDKAAHRSIQATALSNVGKGDERIMAGHHSPPIASARF
jgi:hypothetical protein